MTSACELEARVKLRKFRNCCVEECVYGTSETQTMKEKLMHAETKWIILL